MSTWKRRDLQLLRAAVFVMWPVLGAAGLVLLAAAMTVVWLLIPFARVIGGEDGYVLTLFGKELK